MSEDKVQKAKGAVALRQQAYQQTFNEQNQFVRKVLEDLAAFCRANQTTFHTDSRAHALLEGRREVFLRIQEHIKLNAEQLWKLYGRKGLE